MYDALFSPIRIGARTLASRVLAAPLTTCTEDEGAISDATVEFWQRLAGGGAALVVLGDVAVHTPLWCVPSAAHDRFVPGLRRLADAVHAAGSLVGGQLYHRGVDVEALLPLVVTRDAEALRQALVRSAAVYPNQASAADLERTVELFGAAAHRLAAAGFDLIQIHGDHLLGALASDRLNKRCDHLGGDLEPRLRLSCQIVARVRAVAPDLVIDYKLPVIPEEELGPVSGTRLDELGRAVPLLEQAGVDCWHVCRSASHSDLETAMPTRGDEACFATLGQAVKQVARRPVAVVGRIRDPGVAARLIENGQCDLVALGRQLIADPAWPRKVRSQQIGAIARCDLCNKGCVAALAARRPIACRVHPLAAR